MTSVKRKLYGLTVGELKELLKEVDDKTEIAVWAEIPLQKAELEIDCQRKPSYQKRGAHYVPQPLGFNIQIGQNRIKRTAQGAYNRNESQQSQKELHQ